MAIGYRPWASGTTGGVRTHRVIVQSRRQFQVGSHGLVPGDLAARLGGHPPEDAGHGGLGAELRFVIGLVLANGREQQVVLDLVRVLVVSAGRLPDLVGRRRLIALEDPRHVLPFAQDRRPLAAVDHDAKELPAAGHPPALGHQPRAVGKRVLHRVMIEELVGLGAGLATALPLGRNGPRALDPTTDVEVVNQPVQEETAVEPGVAGVVADLVAQLADVRRAGMEAHGTVHAIGPEGDHDRR